MEKFAIPSGFESLTLEGLEARLCLEDLPSNKQLVLITAPQNFNVETLIGQQLIENGCKLIENTNDDSTVSNNIKTKEKWELHSSTTTSDHHLNILLPSKMQDKHCYAGNFSHALNVLPNLQIPDFASPRKEGLPPPLPRPQGLWTRWKPFGIGGRSFNKQKSSNQGCDHGGSDTDYTVISASPRKRMSKSPRKTHQQVYEEQQQVKLEHEQQEQKPEVHQEFEEEQQQDPEHMCGDIEDSCNRTDNSSLPGVHGQSPIVNGFEGEGVKKKKKKKKTVEVLEVGRDPPTNQDTESSLVNSFCSLPEHEKPKKKKKKKVVADESKENGAQLLQVKAECKHEEALLANNVPNDTSTQVEQTKKKKKKRETKDVLTETTYYIDTDGNSETNTKKKKKKKSGENVPGQAYSPDKQDRTEENIERKTSETAGEVPGMYYIDTTGETESKKKKKKKEKETEKVETGSLNMPPNPLPYDENITTVQTPKTKKKKKKIKDVNDEDAPVVVKVEPILVELEVKPATANTHNGLDISNMEVKTKRKRKRKKSVGQSDDVPNDAIKVEIKKEMCTPVKIQNDSTNIVDTNSSNIGNSAETNTKTKKKKKKKEKINEGVELVLQPPVKVEAETDVPTLITETPKLKKRKKKKNLGNPEAIAVKIEELGERTDTSNLEIKTVSAIDEQFMNGKVDSKKKRKKNKIIDENITVTDNKPVEDSGGKKKAKKRKRKSENPLKCSKYLSDSIKKEEVEPERLQNGVAEDSDLDSDAEARILGATPRKRVCSR